MTTGLGVEIKSATKVIQTKIEKNGIDRDFRSGQHISLHGLLIFFFSFSSSFLFSNIAKW